MVSVSYGLPELGTTASQRDVFSVEAMKLALRGVTIFVSSGDNGVSLRYFEVRRLVLYTVGPESGQPRFRPRSED